MTQLAGSTVLVTGAAGGFGRQLIRQLLQDGCRLLLTDLNREALEDVAAEISSGVPRGEVLGCIGADLSTPEGCQRLFASARDFGAVDVLVNNAGIGLSGYFHEVPVDRWERLMEVNLMAPMRLTHLFVPGMIERGRGHIVIVASIAGWVTAKGMGSYCASKFGARGFGQALREDLDAFGIPVTNVYPWFSDTPILDSEHFGTLPRLNVPRHLASDPADVVREIVAGIRENRAEVFPDRTARKLHWMQRLAPWLVAKINRKMEERTAAASQVA